MLKSIIGSKVGMTQVFDEKGKLVPVTVIEAGPCVVTAIKTIENHGYNAVQLGFSNVEEKKLNKAQVGHLKKNNIACKKILKEFRINDVSGLTVGQEIKADIFKAGDYVDVTGVSKGKGFAGVIKRHNFSQQPVTRGASDRTRARGSSGSQGPQRVVKGMRMSGRLGQDTVTIQKLLVVNVDVEKNVLLVRGAVPAVKKATLIVNNTLKKIPAVVVKKEEKKGKK